MAIKQANAVADNSATQAAESAAEAQAQAVETVGETQVVETAEPVVETADQEPAAAAAAGTGQVEDRAAESESVLDEEEVLEEPAAAPATGNQQVVAQTGTTAVSTNNSAVKGAFMQEILAGLADQGFEDTELDYSSFLNITLNKQIETSEGQELPSSGFLVRLASAKAKYCFRNNNPVEDEVEVAYSYDKEAHKDPESPVFAAIQKWKEEGLELGDIKKYQEVLAVMVDDSFNVESETKGELNGKLITLQIPPTSQGRWGGYLVQLGMAKKGISDVITLCRRGKKVESGKFPFYPWDFVNKGSVENFGL